MRVVDCLRIAVQNVPNGKLQSRSFLFSGPLPVPIGHFGGIGLIKTCGTEQTFGVLQRWIRKAGCHIFEIASLLELPHSRMRQPLWNSKRKCHKRANAKRNRGACLKSCFESRRTELLSNLSAALSKVVDDHVEIVVGTKLEFGSQC